MSVRTLIAVLLAAALSACSSQQSASSPPNAYRSAAEQGDAQAQFNLGVCYLTGKGVPQNDTEAARWFQKAAEQGNVRAQANLAQQYFNGDGVPKDDTQGVKWAQLAAQQGEPSSEYRLASAYGLGIGGLTRDNEKAIYWCKKSAEHGSADAQYTLGTAYYNGKGVGKDQTEGLKWIDKAAAAGNVEAKEWLESHKNAPSRNSGVDNFLQMRTHLPRSEVTGWIDTVQTEETHDNWNEPRSSEKTAGWKTTFILRCTDGHDYVLFFGPEQLGTQFKTGSGSRYKVVGGGGNNAT